MKTYGVLNIVAHPHPAGTYRRLFEDVSGKGRGIRFYGERFAALSPLSSSADDVFTGRLATWTQIDKTANTIDIQAFEERLFDESGVSIPDNVGFNSRVFSFAFNEKSHRLTIETRNVDGETLSIALAAKAMAKILESNSVREVEEIDVFVATRKDAIERLLSVEKIRKIEIELNLPNPDDLSDLEEEILRELVESNIKREKTEIVRRAGADTISLTNRHKAKAQLAKDNGSMKVTGFQGGEKIELSTKEYPEEIVVLDSESDGLNSIRRIALNE